MSTATPQLPDARWSEVDWKEACVFTRHGQTISFCIFYKSTCHVKEPKGQVSTRTLETGHKEGLWSLGLLVNQPLVNFSCLASFWNKFSQNNHPRICQIIILNPFNLWRFKMAAELFGFFAELFWPLFDHYYFMHAMYRIEYNRLFIRFCCLLRLICAYISIL